MEAIGTKKERTARGERNYTWKGHVWGNRMCCFETWSENLKGRSAWEAWVSEG